ncbi:MAG: putative quinol monooxygenase [Acetobacter aceti]|uniref:Antibiotic biosynthesis monooxygenase n=1 Tax=Acetobacter aceti TaxID=435 RepID=A0A1U9KJ85_ACEAC|nr:putative quinol monooxygenase [Acetobacter aceti]AQS85875.1 antibiotic biosynthesis monooxygenase [Acetobacter aceti]
MSAKAISPVTVVASFRLLPDRVAEVLPVVAACVTASRKEATNLSYTCRRDRDDPLHFVFVEQWRSVDAIRQHEEQPHFLALKSALEAGADGTLAVTLLEDDDRLA